MPIHLSQVTVPCCELALGRTAGGIYFYSRARRELLLRAPDGRLLKVIARHPVARHPLPPQFDLESRSLFFVANGALSVAHGSNVRRLDGLRRWGMSNNVSVRADGRLIEVLDHQRAKMTIVRAGGSVFASTRVKNPGFITSPIAIAPNGGAIAFSAVSSAGSRGTAWVYVLPQGADRAKVVFQRRYELRCCGGGYSLGWQHGSLIYSDANGSTFAIDPGVGG